MATIESDRAWLVKDIRAYKQGANFAAREEGELQGRYMGTGKLERRLGIAHPTLRRHVSNKRWDRVPQPEGFVSKGKPYWLRDKAERWLAENG